MILLTIIKSLHLRVLQKDKFTRIEIISTLHKKHIIFYNDKYLILL